MLTKLCVSLCLLASALSAAFVAAAQTVNAGQAVTLEGLRLTANKGSFKAAQYAPDGSLLLLYDQGDGVRLLKTDAKAATITAQAQTGAAGDSGLVMALDPSGDVYVAGTSTSGSLSGTAGALFPQTADASTNSFLAKFDPNLNLVFLTFLGAGRTVAAGVSATSDAVFVTGYTYSDTLPVTNGALLQTPASASMGNGFVERFSADGTALNYATYLTGAGGDTTPAAIVADSADNAYITGETSAAGFPVLNALQPRMLGTTAGFLTKLVPAGNALAFSTFIPGSGITSLALDSGTNTLLLTGNISLGQFPVANVAAPVANIPYQSLLRISEDGGSVPESVLLAPGSQSFVSAGPGGTAWVSGSLETPLFQTGATANASLGDSFLIHLTQTGSLDQTARFGGMPVTNASYASLTSTVAAPAINADGSTSTIPGTLTATASAPLVASQTFDLTLTGGPTTALPNLPGDLLPATCSGLSQCNGSGGLLAMLTTGDTATSLGLSIGDLPNLTLRNAGSATAVNLAISVSGYNANLDCGGTLAPAAQCAIALSGSGPGSITVAAGNAPQLTVPLPETTASADPLALSSAELDFGIVTAADSPVTRTVTVTNLSGSAQSFPSAGDGVPPGAPYTLAETASTCAGTSAAHTVAPNSTCTVTLGLSASSTAANDGPVSAAWKIGARDVALTGITQVASLSVSAAEIDFGTLIAGSTPSLPRYVYLSNSSATPVAHTPVSLPGNSPFSVTDACPSTLEANSVCQITLLYNQPTAPSSDSTTLTLDAGVTALVTGETLATQVSGSATPSLSVSPASLSFPDPVVVTETSSTPGVVTLTNSGNVALPLAASVTGDFVLANGCGTLLNPGASCFLTVGFAPSQPGVREGLLSITSGNSFASTLVSLTGTASALLPVNNGTLALGDTSIGEPTVAWYKVQASVASLTASVTGSAFGVALIEDNGNGHGSLPLSGFAPSATSSCANCWLGVQFVPQTAGTAAADLTLNTVSGGNSYQLAVTGTGDPVQGLVVTPANQDFGTVPLGSSSAPLLFTLANLLTPPAGVTVEAITASGDFKLTTNSTGGASCPGFLASTASCFVEVSFVPTATGERTGTLTVTTSNGVATAALTGSAVADPGLGISPTSLSFNNQPGSGTGQQNLTLTNTGTSVLSVGPIAASSSSFTVSSPCTTLSPGASCTVGVAFTPGANDAIGSLSVAVVSSANPQGSPITYTVPVTGTYTGNEAGLLLLPSEANFGAQTTGSLGQTRQFTLQNTSSATETVSLNVPQQFPLAAPFACGTLAAGASCTFSVSFLPETGGALTGSLSATATFASGASAQALGYLLGYGTASGTLSISGQPIPNAPVDFGQVPSGQSTPLTLTLTNTGSGALTLRQIVSASPFLATSTCGAALAPGANCAATITYAPVYEVSSTATSPAPRTDTGTLTVESDAASSPDQVPLAGSVQPVAPASGPSTNAVLASYTLSQGALTFANTQVGDISPAQTISLVNSGTSTLTVGAVLAPPDYAATTNCTTLAPAASCTISVSFAPEANTATVLRAGTLEIQSSAPDALEFVSLLGMSSPAPLTLNPATLDFGTVDLGQSDQLSVTATNTASLPITFGQLNSSGDYATAQGTCPLPGAPLPAGQSCTVVLTFAPTETGTRTGSLSVATNATENPLSVALTGVAVAAKLQISPGALAFGSISVGVPAVLTLNLSNSGSASLTGLAFSISGADAADFAITTPCPLTTYTPLTGCTMQVTFQPSGIGARLATLTATSSDPASPLLIPLTGTGIQAGGFTLTVAGGTASSTAVTLGSPASYPLTVTPHGEYAGSVVLTCMPLAPAPYAACSLLSPQLNLGNGTQSATATITTTGGVSGSQFSPWGLLCGVPLLWLLYRRRDSGFPHLLLLALIVGGTTFCLSLTACAGPANSGQNMTPPGTYQYTVTATSTGGVQLSSSVSLQLIVQ